jgi:hypothetical protein
MACELMALMADGPISAVCYMYGVLPPSCQLRLRDAGRACTPVSACYFISISLLLLLLFHRSCFTPSNNATHQASQT